MNTCRSVREKISESLDSGEALPARASEHLAGCDACESFRMRVSALGAQLSRPVPQVAFPAGLHDRIMSAVNEAGSSGAPERVTPFMRWLAPVAAAAAVAVLAVSLWPKKEAGSFSDTPSKASGDLSPAPTQGVETGFEGAVDLASLTAAVDRGVGNALGGEAKLIVADVGRVRDFFGSRLKAMSMSGL